MFLLSARPRNKLQCNIEHGVSGVGRRLLDDVLLWVGRNMVKWENLRGNMGVQSAAEDTMSIAMKLAAILLLPSCSENLLVTSIALRSCADNASVRRKGHRRQEDH